MKILQVIQKSQLRGAEIFACQLSNHLLQDGHQVVLITLMQGDSHLPFNGELIRFDRPVSRRLVDIVGWRMLASAVSRFSPDVVVAHAGDTLKFTVLSRLMFGWKAPLIFRNANKAGDFLNSWPKKIFNRLLVRQLHQVISVSEVCRLDFITSLRFPSDRTTMIPVGVEKGIEPGTLPGDLRACFGGDKVLINVAGLVPEKNQVGLLRIAQILKERNVSVRILIVGEGRLQSRLENLVEQMNLTEEVLFLGRRTDVHSILPHCAALLMTSHIEGLPAVILEAFRAKLPVVAYNVGGIGEVVKNGETGWLIERGKEAQFADAVQDVLSDRPTDRIVENARRLVQDQFDNRLIARKFVDVFTKVSKRKA